MVVGEGTFNQPENFQRRICIIFCFINCPLPETLCEYTHSALIFHEESPDLNKGKLEEIVATAEMLE